jgi:pentatricopeptide repeat-containing protein PET309
MLERATTCLESGRQLLRAPKSCLRTRRTLHSAFWHHGASDLNLPIWWAATSIFGRENGDVDDRPTKTKLSPTASHNGTLLDFLYPEKTLAVLKRLSVRVDAIDAIRRPLGTPIRRFSTAQRQPPHDESSVDAVVAQAASEEMGKLLQDSSALHQLYKVLRMKPFGKQELAWQLYNAVPHSDTDSLENWALRRDLLVYLTANDECAVPSRVLQLWGELPREERVESSYRAAIVAYIFLRMVGPAIQLLEEAPIQFDMAEIGTDVLLRRTVSDEQWDLSLRIFRLFLRQTPTQPIGYHNTLPALFRSVKGLPELQERLQSFLQHVREYQHELTSTRERSDALSAFVASFVPHVIHQVLQTRRTDDRFISKYLRQLFADMRSLELPVDACYQHAIYQTLDLPRYQTSVDRQKLWLDDLYEHYRQLCLDLKEFSAKTAAKPSLHLLRNLIVHRNEHDTVARAEAVIQDLRLFYPGQPFKPGLLKYLINMYADHGNTTLVEQYMDEFTAHYKDSLDPKLVSALLYSCARRADIDGAITQFNRIRGEFGLVPDTVSWNILLLAYVRADDLDGALECFNRCVDAGTTPDKYTYGTLMDLCADRGDVEAFEALFSRAKSMGISMTQDERARSGYVQVFLNAGDPEGAMSIAQGMLRSWQNGTLRGSLTHAWNLLIQHHALNRDIASSRQCYREMIDNSIPLDSWTYGSLMRALVEVKQSNAAFRILKKTMPENNLRVEALHYAIVLTGLMKEGGGQLDLAMDAYRHMIKRKVPQTESSREASILLLGKADLDKLKKRRAKHPNYRLLQVEEALEEMLVEAAQGQIAHRQPSHSRYRNSFNYGAVPQTYYALMVSLYTNRRAYKICEKLLKKADEAAPDTANYITPMTLITASMDAHLKAGDHAEVARYWDLALTTATKLTKTVHQIMQPDEPVPESDSILDPSVRLHYEQSRISNSRRHMLFKASRSYIRSLLDPRNPKPNTLQEAQRTMRTLLVNGYSVDNYVWNEYIVTLAQRGSIIDAFTICEDFLMPQFPGWRDLHPNYYRKDRQGYSWMALRHYEIKKSSLLPRYQTLIVLAAELRRVKNEERSGIGYNEKSGAWTREILERAGPMTIRAIESMPRTNDGLQRKFFP